MIHHYCLDKGEQQISRCLGSHCSGLCAFLSVSCFFFPAPVVNGVNGGPRPRRGRPGRCPSSLTWGSGPSPGPRWVLSLPGNPRPVLEHVLRMLCSWPGLGELLCSCRMLTGHTFFCCCCRLKKEVKPQQWTSYWRETRLSASMTLVSPGLDRKRFAW